MIYRVLADVTLVVHLAFVLFVVLGGVVVLRWRRVVWVHLPAAAWGALIMFGGWTCPLTPLENAFRVRGGEAGYQGGFIEHYLVRVLYPRGLERETQVLLGMGVVGLNLAVYGIFHRGRSRPGPDGPRKEPGGGDGR